MTPRYLHYPVPVYKGPVVLSSFWQYLWTGLTTTLWMTSEAYRGSLVQWRCVPCMLSGVYLWVCVFVRHRHS